MDCSPQASRILEKARESLDSIPVIVRGQIADDLGELCAGNFSAVYTKKLRGKIKELIVGDYRAVFFVQNNSVFVTSIFRKKSKKTPVREIEYAEKIYKLMSDL